jgi:phytoene synthase
MINGNTIEERNWQVDFTGNLDFSFAAAEQSIRQNSKTFYLATSLLPGRKRRAIRALYGFCRATDNLVDIDGANLAAVERWRCEVSLPPEKQRDPILLLWALTRQEFGVDPIYEGELIDGVARDLQPARYRTWEELEDYCYHVASTVGLLSMPIIGLAKGVTFSQAAPYAIRLGVALQLTNILRDIGEDAERGKVYLPEEDLNRFGLTRSDIINKVLDRRFSALIQFEIERARQLYRQALPGIAKLSWSGRLAVGAAALLYRAILDEIEAIQYHVYQARAHVAGKRKLAMLPGIILTVLFL